MINETDLESFGYWDIIPEREKPVSVMVSQYNILADNVRDPHLYEGLIMEEYDEWLWTDDTEPQEVLKELADLVYVLYGYAWALGWDLDEAVRRVHKNNVQRMTQDDGTIQRRADDKIIKNPNTPKVDLSDLV